ncbi:MAG: 2-oxoacid:ferredoxin oxidoreductase subunit gamma [Planctomycetota bacterium]|nr:MAG: 2-oxoacid:ferredoxin oxidoreductase subunit gamma [Planctomycetota bacterium]
MENNETRIIIGGFGGQGVVSAGSILARAAMAEEKFVTQMVSYGAEMRGGTANSTVVISDSQIASPVIERPDVAILLNQPSLDKFEERIVSGGLAVVNTSLVTRRIQREDLDVVKIDATDTANRLGNVRVANIVALGAFVAKTGIVKMESVEGAIEEVFGQKKAGLIEINIKALGQK